jgi:hypothetical protein
MYGVDSFVHPDYRSQGVGGKLMEARFATARKLNLRGMVAGSLIMDYHKVARSVPVEQYVREVAAGKRFDGNLSKQLKKGFKVAGIVPNYADSWGSLGYAVTILWDNPDYRPAQRPTAPLLYPPVLRQQAAHS